MGLMHSLHGPKLVRFGGGATTLAHFSTPRIRTVNKYASSRSLLRPVSRSQWSQQAVQPRARGIGLPGQASAGRLPGFLGIA
jgi:hypothetical protein